MVPFIQCNWSNVQNPLKTATDNKLLTIPSISQIDYRWGQASPSLCKRTYIYVVQNTECLRMSEKVRKVLRRPQLVWNWFNMVSFNWKFVASPFLPSWPIKKNHLGNSRILECNACNVHLSQGFLETDRSLWLSVEEDQVSEDTLPLIRLFSYVFPIPNKQKH